MGGIFGGVRRARRSRREKIAVPVAVVKDRRMRRHGGICGDRVDKLRALLSESVLSVRDSFRRERHIRPHGVRALRLCALGRYKRRRRRRYDNGDHARERRTDGKTEYQVAQNRICEQKRFVESRVHAYSAVMRKAQNALREHKKTGARGFAP